MANIKFSAFTQKAASADVDFLVGYTGADNVRVAPSVFDNVYLPLAGGTMTGDIDMGDNDISDIKSIAFNDGGATITEVKDEDDMAADSATMIATQQSIKAYVDTNQYHFIRAAFNYSSGAGTQIILPLDGTTRPKTAFASLIENTCMIAPFDGTLETILFRSEEVAGNPVVMGFHKVSDGTEVPIMLATGTVSIDMSSVAAHTTTAFNFTSNNTFSAGDVLGFTCDPANDINDCVCVIILKYDTTTGL